MGEETEPTAMAEGVTADEPSRDHRRKRKKLLHKSLLELMEFYLGDVNLTHDKFLSERIQGKPFVYVDLSIFLTFNRVKALTSDIQDLANAIKHSQFLQLSEDETKVCRITPIKKKENEDECTIYVEQLGPDVNHDILTKVFSEFGPVDFISLPRYSHNGKFKGFAFVEFRDPECAKKALELLSAKGCCLSPHMAPEELVSVKTFDGNDKHQHNKERNGSKEQLNKKKNKRKHSNDDIVKHATDEAILPKSNDEEPNEKKIKLEPKVADPPESEQPKQKGKSYSENKKRKLSSHEEKNNSGKEEKVDEEDKNEERPAKKKAKSDTEDTASVEVEQPKQEETSDSENKKRKFSTSKDNSDKEEKVDEEDKNEDRPAKKKAKSNTEGASETEDTSHTEEETAANSTKQQKKRKRKKKIKKDKVTASSLGLRVLSKMEWKKLRNKYLNMQKDVMTLLKKQLYTPKPKVGGAKVEEQFKPGTVIKVTLEEPVVNTTTTKSEFRVHPEICYVDTKEGSPCVYLRTTSPELATSVVQTKHWPNMEIIQGEEEAAYWDKIKKDRLEYFQQKSKRNQRGRTKLLKRAEKFQEKQI